MDKKVTLNQLEIGQQAKITKIEGGRLLARRLMGLGLKQGSQVEVLHRRGGGVVVGNGGNRIAIGAGIAGKLAMELVNVNDKESFSELS